MQNQQINSDEEQTERCAGTLGSRPWWMSPDQYDPCRCTLLASHEGDHQCAHTAARVEDAASQPQGSDR
jgi:hypothetical protein